MLGDKNYYIRMSKHKNGGLIFKISEYEPVWAILIEGALLLGVLGYAYIKLKGFF
jgi:hypothetical protein